MQMKIFDFEQEKVGQESEEDILGVEKDTLREAVLWGTDWTTETVVAQLKKKNIELSPSFQRRDAWGEDRKSSFIESIILGLPIPQIILAERKDKKGSYLVIDGKQRLLSIRQFCVTDTNEDFSGLRLKGLRILKFLNGKTYNDLISDPDLSEYYSAFENQSIRTVMIKNWPDQSFLYTVFLRLNTGSLQLSPQELRQALIPGPFISFADDFSINSTEIKQVLNLQKPDYRMRDVEIVVRFFAFKNFIQNYDGKLKEFLDMACMSLNSNWDTNSTEIISMAESLNNAIRTTYAIFENDAFNKYGDGAFTNIFNRPVYDIMTYYFSDKKISDSALQKSTEIKAAFIKLCTSDNDFLRSLETSTKNIDPTAKRFGEWGNALKTITGLDFKIPTRGRIGLELT